MAQPPAPTPRNSRPPTLLRQLEVEVSEIVSEAQPAVVSIEGKSIQFHFPLPDSLRQQMLREFSQMPAERRAELERNFLLAQGDLKAAEKTKMFSVGPPQAGSGFLIDGGFVVTTAEVVDNMTEISVVLASGKRVRPLWINADPYSNIAVLKLNVPDTPRLEWGDFGQMRQGNFGIVIGNQAGFANSSSLAFVAGMNRSGRSGSLYYRNLIQFQGVVGAGNSGSPLLDSQGGVIGMVVAAPAGGSAMPLPVPDAVGGNGQAGQNQDNFPSERVPRSRTFVLFNGIANTGFALPADHLRSIVEVLIKGQNSKPIRDGWLGFYVQTKADTGDAPGLLVTRVYADSPAAKAGLLPLDRILSINGQAIKNFEQVEKLTKNVKSGVVFQVEMIRGRAKHTLALTTEPRPDPDTLRQTMLLLPPRPPKN